ncbi:fimbria/pilus outer membrane usher protein [Serratia nevei]|uniref:fimbria/pilus outer membrane usher protein n=1 Tax=Serratia nevei TaxID=2703794 RepID=UPI003FA71070
MMLNTNVANMLFWDNKLLRVIISMIILTFYSGLSCAENENRELDQLTFDPGALEAAGITPSVAENFRHAPRFMSGENVVSLVVNGSNRGKINVKFDNAGLPCINHAFITHAGISIPASVKEDTDCFDLVKIWPQTEIKLDPNEGKISLIAPPGVLSKVQSDNWQHGGIAGVLNYDVQYMNSFGEIGNLNYAQAGTEIGLNAADWILRSRQIFTSFNGKNQLTHQAAYAQRTFIGINKVLQAGQVNLSNSLFGTGQVLGFQLFPEMALSSPRGGAGLVEGVAETTSVVEVRQSGVLVYSTTVPAGPFKLQGFSLLNTRTELKVKVISSNGMIQEFIIPAAVLQFRAPQLSSGLTLGAGRLEQVNGKSPLLATLATGWQLTPFTSINSGVLTSAKYKAGSVSSDIQVFQPTHLTFQSTIAKDAEHNNTGLLMSAILNHDISERISLNVNGSRQTRGYRELSDALQIASSNNSNGHERVQYQWGSGISWSVEAFGNLSLSWARSNTFAGSNTDYIRGGWSRQFGRASLGVSIEHNTGMLQARNDDRLYVSLSLPLGEGRDIGTYQNVSRGYNRAGIRYSNRTSQDRGWSISSDHNLSDKRATAGASVDFVTPVSQLSGSISHDNSHYTSWSAHASGAAVVHNNSVILSPYRVADTFGIAKVGEQPGVLLETPAGPVWTNNKGLAVLPTLNKYYNSGIQIDTRTLAKNVDVSNAWQETNMARGAVGRVDFEVIQTRRVLITATLENGDNVPYGYSVFDQSGNLISVVGNEGTIFVTNATPTMILDVLGPNKKPCRIRLSIPEKIESDVLYENFSTVCN